MPGSIEQAVVYLRFPKVLEPAHQFIDRLMRLSPGPSIYSSRLVVRRVLSACLTAYKSNTIFEFVEPVSIALQATSTNFLAVMHDAASTLAAKGLLIEVERGMEFKQLLHEHLQAYQAWELVDKARMIERIMHAVYSLRVAELSTAHYMPGDPVRIRLARELTRQHAMIVRIGGPAALARLEAFLLETPPVATVREAVMED